MLGHTSTTRDAQDLGNRKRYWLNPNFRFHVPGLAVTSNLWLIENLASRQVFAVTESTVRCSLACHTGLNPEDSEKVWAEITGWDVQRLHLLRSTLLSRDVIRLAAVPPTVSPAVAGWLDKGWVGAADYHLITLDYPFVRYSSGWSPIDVERMKSYAAEHADIDRYKTYPNNPSQPLPRPNADLLRTAATQAMRRRTAAATISAGALLDALSMTFCATGRTNLPWPGSVPLLRRTSPSGGGRHPCEAYVVVWDVPGLRPGWYHVNAGDERLESLAEIQEDVTTIFSGLSAHADYQIRAAVVMTCVWARNRYRYREPRTFRSVHMDAGHLATTLEICLGARGLRATALQNLNEIRLEQILGLDPVVESVMTGVIIGDSTPPSAN